MSRSRPSSNFRNRLGIAFAAAALFAGCEKPQPVAEALPPAAPVLPVPTPSPSRSPSLPVDRILTDQQGRSLDARIVAKDPREVHVVRKSDRVNFTIPVGSLSPADQQFVAKLDDMPPPAGFRHGKVFGTAAELPLLAGEDPPYVINRREMIARLREKLELLEAEAEATTNASIKRSKLSEARRAEEEISRMELDLRNYLK